jgi:hypothetical protein
MDPQTTSATTATTATTTTTTTTAATSASADKETFTLVHANFYIEVRRNKVAEDVRAMLDRINGDEKHSYLMIEPVALGPDSQNQTTLNAMMLPFLNIIPQTLLRTTDKVSIEALLKSFNEKIAAATTTTEETVESVN